MKTFCSPFVRRSLGLAAAGAFSLTCLSSCGDDGPQAKDTGSEPSSTVTETKEAPVEHNEDSLKASRDALFNAAVYDLALTISDNDQFPVFNTKSRDFLELLEKYCTELRATSKDQRERVRATTTLAKVLRNVGGAYPRAEAAFRDALQECQALSPEELAAPEGQRTLSSINNGIASCLLMQGNSAEAMKFYTEALKIDKAQFDAVDMKEDQPISGNAFAALSRAVVEVVDSYRCLADCQLIADDPEEALDTYKKGIGIAEKYQGRRPTVEMAISFSKIYTAYGNLEQKNGDSAKARQAWSLAAQLCAAVYKGTKDPLQKLKTERDYDALIRVLKATQPAADAAAEVKPASK